MTFSFQRFVLAVALALLSLQTQAAALLRLEPATGSLTVGDSISVRLMGSGLVDLYAFQFALRYTPGLFSLVGVSEGDALSGVGSTFFVAGSGDDALGELSLTGNTLIGAQPGFSGDGWLATIELRAIGAGAAALELGELLLLDADLDLIDLSAENARFDIAPGGGHLPLPGSLALCLLALPLLGARRRSLPQR